MKQQVSHEASAQQYTRGSTVACVAICLAGLLAACIPPAELPQPEQPFAAWIGPNVVGTEVGLTLATPAVDSAARDGRPVLVWRHAIEDDRAAYITPHFSYFDLPADAYLVIAAPDGSRRWEYRGFGQASLSEPGEFWGLQVRGQTAAIELWSAVPLPEGAVLIDRYARGLDTPDLSFSDERAICGSDDSQWAACYQSSQPTIYQRSRAVARLMINGSSACTGWLVGDQGHLLTNQHCIGSASDAANTTFEFMAEGATCSTSCATWGACAGTVAATSAEFIKASSTYDYALVKLPASVAQTYGYLQLRAGGAALGERIYVPQYPAGWGKKIAVTSTASQDSGGFCTVTSLSESPCFGTGQDIGYYADTQGGSSGSPVLAYSDHLVVALHHCANCPNRGVPIQAVIQDLGALLPASALSGGSTPPPPPPPPPAEPVALANGVAVSNLSGATGSVAHYRITVPTGATNLSIVTSGGSGDVDLYVKRGAQPTTSSYDYRPYQSGNAETVTVATPAAGEWYVMLHGYAAYSGATLRASFTTAAPPTPPPPSGATLSNGVPLANLSGAASSEQTWILSVPAGATNLSIAISGGSGDADLYVKRGAQPTTSSYDYRPYLGGNNETVTVASPAAGDWYVMLRGYSAYSGVTLKASYTTSGGGTGSSTFSGSVAGKASQTHALAVSGGTISLSLTWSTTSDLDLYLLNPSGTQVASALSTNKPETLSYQTNGVTGSYTIRVYNYTSGAAATSYTLTATVQ